MGRKPTPKTSEQSYVEDTRFHKQHAAVGIMKVAVYVPAGRIPELRELALRWRAEAKQLVEGDYPTADQILQIHAICRALEIELPLDAFATISSAAKWLRDQESKLGERQIQRPRVRQPPVYSAS